MLIPEITIISHFSLLNRNKESFSSSNGKKRMNLETASNYSL